jgi:hypothetical protein
MVGTIYSCGQYLFQRPEHCCLQGLNNLVCCIPVVVLHTVCAEQSADAQLTLSSIEILWYLGQN